MTLYHHVIPHNIAFVQRTLFTSWDVWPWAYNYGFHWYYHVVYWGSLHDTKIKWSSEEILAIWIRWQQPEGLGHSSLEWSVCFESDSNIWYGFSHTQDPWSLEWWGGGGNNSTHLSLLRSYWENICFFFLWP